MCRSEASLKLDALMPWLIVTVKNSLFKPQTKRVVDTLRLPRVSSFLLLTLIWYVTLHCDFHPILTRRLRRTAFSDQVSDLDSLSNMIQADHTPISSLPTLSLSYLLPRSSSLSSSILGYISPSRFSASFLLDYHSLKANGG